ncbi:MAG: magnesium transporter [Verrucomicrobia bacterium]|nr:magnesium transporter [Verrucomicrobiota bacterium]
MRLDISKGLSSSELQSPISTFMVKVATAFHEEMTIEEVLAILRKREIPHIIQYFYSVDDEHVLTGILATRDLLMSEPTTKLKAIVDRDVVAIEQNETLLEGIKLLEKQGIQAVPVVDQARHIKGIFEIVPEHKHQNFDPAKAIQKVTSKDIYQLIGLSLQLGRVNSTLLEFRYRMPWLFCTMFAGLVCATVAATFKPILSQYVVLAMFIPLVLSLGESVAMQSMSLSLQFLHYGKVHWKPFFRRIAVEWSTALLIGFSCAFLIGSVFWVWNSTFHAMLAVTSSIFMTMIFSTTLGTTMPVILHLLSLDPKVAAGPVVLMLTDIFASLIYLAISNWLLTTFVQ